MLYVMAERWSPAQQYRNAFEHLKEKILEHISSGTPAPQDPSPGTKFTTARQDALKQVFASVGMESLGQVIDSIANPEEQQARQNLPFGITTETEELAFGTDNLGPIVFDEDWIDYGEDIGSEEVRNFDFRGGPAYNLNVLDAILNSQRRDVQDFDPDLLVRR